MLGHRALVTEDYLSILKRRKWILALPVVLLPIIAYGVTFLMVPQYLSQTLVLIEGQKVPEGYVKPVVASNLDERLASMREQILSRSSLQPIIERYNLFADSHASMDDRIEEARKSIDIKPITSEVTHSGGLPGFFISFKAGDAHTAQMICGEITSLFLGENLRSREASAEGTTSFLRSQLDDAKRNLDDQDAKLAAFEAKYMGRLPDESSPNMNMLTTLNTQLDAATQALSRMEQDKVYQESMLSQQLQQQQERSSATTGQVSADNQEKELQTLLNQEADLSAHYTANYPDLITVRRKIADLRHQMAHAASAPAPGAPTTQGPSRSDSASVQQLRAAIQASVLGIAAKRKEQAQIQAQIHTYQDRIQSSPMVEQQYKQLTRDHETAQTFYSDLLNKMNQSKMATDLEKRQEGEQFRVMDEPNLPDAPFSPRRGAFVIGGIAAGFGIGLLIIAFLEYKDTTLRSERDVWAFTQLPTLAVIGQAEDAGTARPGFIWRLMHPSLRKAIPAAERG